MILASKFWICCTRLRLTSVVSPQIDSPQSIFDCTWALYILRSKADGRIFLKWRNIWKYVYIFLHNYRMWASQLRSFLIQRPKCDLACLARNSLSESTEIVKSSQFNNFNCHLLPITMTLDFFSLIHSLFKLYQLDMLSIQTCDLHSNSSFDVAGV